MSANGQLVFTDVDKITFKGVGNASNAVIDTLTGKIGVGIDSPEANLHVVGNSYVSTNLELGGTLIMGTVNVEAQHSLEAVTATGNTTPLTIEFTNPTTSLVASGNVEVGGNVVAGYLYGDGSNISGISSNLDQIVNIGNVTSNTVQFSNAITSLTAASNIVVTGNVTAGSFLGDGSELTALNAANITSGTLDAARIPTLNQSTTGSAGSAATLTTPRSIGGVNFNGSADITPTTFTTATFSGDVGIKRTTARASLDVDGQIFSDWGSSGTSGFVIYNSGPYQMGLKQGNRELELYTKTPDGDGDIRFKPNDVEKMVIKHGGNVGINKTNPGYVLDVHSDDAIHIEQAGNTTFETKIHGGALFIRNPSTSGGYEHVIINNHTTGNHTTSYIQFRRGNTGNGGAIGTISGNGSTITYGGQSDYRVKENIVPMPISGLDTINNLQPKRFNFIGHPDNIYDGFIAHELQEHIPMAVTGEKDEMRGRGNVVKIDDESFIVKEDVSEPDSLEEGTKWVKLTEEPVYQNVDLSKIVTYLVKAVQELSGENQTLKTRLDALENA